MIDNPDPDRPIAPVARQRIRQFWRLLTRAFRIFCEPRRRRRSGRRVLIFRMIVRQRFVDRPFVANCQY